MSDEAQWILGGRTSGRAHILIDRFGQAPAKKYQLNTEKLVSHMINQNFLAFLWSTASTIFGGLILAFLFFLAREKLFPLPAVTGRWHVEIRIRRTSHKPFDGMVLRYVAMVLREGNNLKGTAEKVYENSSTGEREYVGTNRTRSVIDGYTSKNLFSRDPVTLHVVEEGHSRESTHFHDLIVQTDGRLQGRFSTMVADSEGDVTWQREPF